MRAVGNADLIVTTPEKWDGISRSWQTRSYVKAVALLCIDEIHLLGMAGTVNVGWHFWGCGFLWMILSDIIGLRTINNYILDNKQEKL